MAHSAIFLYPPAKFSPVFIIFELDYLIFKYPAKIPISACEFLAPSTLIISLESSTSCIPHLRMSLLLLILYYSLSTLQNILVFYQPIPLMANDKRNRYDEEFKRSTANLYQNVGETQSQLSKEYGISQTALTR